MQDPTFLVVERMYTPYHITEYGVYKGFQIPAGTAMTGMWRFKADTIPAILAEGIHLYESGS